jgi:hypothetical protein
MAGADQAGRRDAAPGETAGSAADPLPSWREGANKQEVYGVPRQRVIGSSVSLAYQEGKGGGTIVHKPEVDVLDDGPQKPVRIWSRVGRRPLLAAGNSNGDIPMLQFAEQPDRPCLRLLLLHDDPDREFDYVAGAEQALKLASTNGWTVISIQDDWTTVF